MFLKFIIDISMVTRIKKSMEMLSLSHKKSRSQDKPLKITPKFRDPTNPDNSQNRFLSVI